MPNLIVRPKFLVGTPNAYKEVTCFWTRVDDKTTHSLCAMEIQKLTPSTAGDWNVKVTLRGQELDIRITIKVIMRLRPCAASRQPSLGFVGSGELQIDCNFNTPADKQMVGTHRQSRYY